MLEFWSGIYTVEFCTAKCTRKRTQPPISGSETRGRMHTKLPSHIRYSSIAEFHERKPFSRNYFRNRPKKDPKLTKCPKTFFPIRGTILSAVLHFCRLRGSIGQISTTILLLLPHIPPPKKELNKACTNAVGAAALVCTGYVSRSRRRRE